jgi:hypothetical protein
MRDRRRALALAVSLALHALLATWLVTRRAEVRSSAARVPPVELELFEPSPAPTAAPIVEAPTRARPAARAHAAPVTAPAPTAAAPDADEAPTTPAPAAPGRPLDLSLGAVPLDARERLQGPAPDVGAAPAPARHGRPSVDELRATIERREDAVANVEKGRVDPFVYEVLRTARKRFDAEARRLAEGISVGAREMGAAQLRGYLEAVRTKKDLGDPLRAEVQGAVKQDPYLTPKFMDVYNEVNRQAALGAEWRAAEVCLRLAPGKEPEPSLRKSSGDGALDRLALDSFARAAAVRDAPGDLRPELACYTMRMRALRMPAVPMFGCALDVGGVSDCRWPFKKVVEVEGHVLDVDYGDAPPTSPMFRRAR